MSSPRPVAPRRARPIFEGPTYMAPRYHSRVWGRLIFLIFVLLLALVVGAGGGLYWLLHRAQGSGSRAVLVHVGTGDGVTSIADRLARKHLIQSTFLFKLDARIQNLGGKLKVGDYTFKKSMSIDQMVSSLQQYHSFGIAVTIPEGWRAEQIAAELDLKGFDGKKFLALVQHPDPRFVRSLHLGVLQDKPAGASLEGYLFPDTYSLSPGESSGQIVSTMIGNLDRKFRTHPQMMTDVKRRGRSIYRVLTLAAIIEREARIQSERPLIAGVYANRIRLGWKLGADPTVQYILGSATPLSTSPTSKKWWPLLEEQAVNIHPSDVYNTYTHTGLPPSPIADAGFLSISAALYPSKTNFLYFVAVKNGRGEHKFARTLDEQNRNIQRFGT